MYSTVRLILAADPHLSDFAATPQEETLDWALSEISRLSPDATVWLGDITACGSPDAVMRFRDKLRALPCPSVVMPGNSDIRTPATAPLVERLLTAYPHGLTVGDLCLVGMNTAHDRLLPAERERLNRLEGGRHILLFSHQHPEALDGDSLDFLRDWIRGREALGQHVLLWAHGHIHVYRKAEFAGVPTLSLRALDPDKCAGGSSQLILLTWDGSGLTEEALTYTRGLPETWTETERRELADWLGITCYDIPRDMAFAIRHGVRHLEWRQAPAVYQPLLDEWRAHGGQTLSVHFPPLDHPEQAEAFHQTSLDAVCAGADMVTVHPPYIPNGQMLACDTFERLADAMADALRPVAEAGITVLVENNHTKYGTGPDPLAREFGCAPSELTGWRDALEERLGRGTCALRLDVGHARNNVPLSQDYPLGKWYPLVGYAARAYHLHQTLMGEGGRMHNHHPITGLHDGLISLDGFLWAWHTGMLTHGPLILEIREGEGAGETWKRLRGIFGD